MFNIIGTLSRFGGGFAIGYCLSGIYWTGIFQPHIGWPIIVISIIFAASITILEMRHSK